MEEEGRENCEKEFQSKTKLPSFLVGKKMSSKLPNVHVIKLILWRSYCILHNNIKYGFNK